MQAEKLKEILEKHEIRLSNKGNVCLSDFVKKIIKSKNPDVYIQKLKGYETIELRGKKYISIDDCIDILQKAKFKHCKEICKKMQFDFDGDKSSVIDVQNKLFQFEGHKFFSFFVDKEDGKWDVWVFASEAAKFLGYVNAEQAIREHVNEDNKMDYEKLSQTFESLKKMGIKTFNKKTIFINVSGFFDLIQQSKKPLAAKIKKWINNEVIPSLMLYGMYCMQPEKVTINHFYNDSTFADYDQKPVLYIAYVGKYKGLHVFKYGIS